MKKINLRDFALHFCFSRNPTESALAAGVTPLKAKIEGLKILSRKSVQTAVKNADSKNLFSEKAVISGLERLAFGRTNDAVSLVFAEEITPAKIQQADLYNVSEIKKIKGGGVEIKFFDRQKAMERLAEYSEKLNSQKNAKNLVETIYGSASEEVPISDCPDEEEE